MGNGCQALFDGETGKIAPLGASVPVGAGLFEWKKKKPGNLGLWCPIGSMFPLKWEIVSMYPAHLRNDDGLAFRATPKRFLRLYIQWVIYFRIPDSFTPDP